MTRKKLLSLLLSVLMIIVAMQSAVYADEAEKTAIKVLEPVTLGKVTLKDNVTAQVSNLIVLPLSDNQMVGLTLSIKNNSNTEVNFLDYWVNLYTKSGTKLNVQLTDPKISKVPAKATVDINFIGTLGSDIKVTDLIVKVIKWDFSVASYTRVLGELSVPQRYSPVTPANNGRAVVTADVKASFIIKQATIGKSESYYRPDIKVIIRNDGNRTITLPDYQLFILTKNNLMYPLSVKDLKGSTLDPLTEKEFQLSTQIPLKVDESGWKVAVVNSINDGKDKQPVAVFELPKAQFDTGEEKGKYYTFSNSKGIYNIKLNTMYRLPMEDDDLIIANLTIANKGKSTLPLPTLNGKYIFNESIEKVATSSNNDKMIAIQPGSTANVQLVGRVPYTFDISKTSLIVQQKESADNSNNEMLDLVEFTYKGAFDQIQKVSSDKGFKIDDVGYRSEVKIRHQMLYSGDSADILVAQLEIKNQEKRQASIQRLAGYYEKQDGTVYPATFDVIADKLSPGGTAIVYVSSTIPKETDTSDVHLVVGKAVTESTTAPSQQDPTVNVVGYTNPYLLELPARMEPMQGLQKMEFSPFQISINRVATQIKYNDSNGEARVTLDLDYSLSQDLLTKSNMKDQKVIVEIKDDNQKAVFTKEVSLPTATKSSGADDISLKNGSHNLKINWDDPEVFRLIQNLKGYELNFYHQIQPGYKSLIATQKFTWLVNRSLN